MLVNQIAVILVIGVMVGTVPSQRTFARDLLLGQGA